MCVFSENPENRSFYDHSILQLLEVLDLAQLPPSSWGVGEGRVSLCASG